VGKTEKSSKKLLSIKFWGKFAVLPCGHDETFYKKKLNIYTGIFYRF
jgi:hypothetical protein